MITEVRESFDEPEIDLREIFSRLWGARTILLICVLVCAGATTAYAFLTTPVYRATAVLTPANLGREGMGGGLSGTLGQLGGLAALAGVNLGDNGPEIEEALAVLKSREFTEQFIQDRNLMPVLFAGLWDASAGRWKVPMEKQPTVGRAYKAFDGRIRTIIRDKKTGLISVQVDWKDRQVAADWANDLVARLNAEMRARAIRKADAAVGYLEKELQTTTVVPTRDAINRLIEAQIKERMFANVNQDYAFRVVDRALAPDKDDPAKPQKALMVAVGILVGLGIGFGIVMLTGAPRGRRLPESVGRHLRRE